jgi:hypothetical protein
LHYAAAGDQKAAASAARIIDLGSECGANEIMVLALALAFALAAGIARADDYPSRPIRLIVPYAAGGGADSVARIIAKRVS